MEELLSDQQDYCYRCLINYASCDHHIYGRISGDTECTIPLCTPCHTTIHESGADSHVDSLLEAREFALGYFSTSE